MAATNKKVKKTKKTAEKETHIDNDDQIKDDNSSSGSVSVYDSADDDNHDDVDYDDEDDDEVEENSDDSDHNDSEEDEDFEDQGSSDDEDDYLWKQQREGDEDDDDSEEEELQVLHDMDNLRSWNSKMKKNKVSSTKRNVDGNPVEKVDKDRKENNAKAALWMHTDDLSSDDDEEGGDDGINKNRIGRVPLHWYDEYEHIGYDVHGQKVGKSSSSLGNKDKDKLDQAIQQDDARNSKKFVVHDALNDRQVELTPRQLELIRRVQAGAFAHPEFDGNPDYIDYVSGVNPEISGLSAQQYEPKRRFQPSKWEKLQVKRLLHLLEKGDIDMDYLTGKRRDMAAPKEPTKEDTFLLWTNDDDDENNNTKGPQHIAAPKLPPPGHAESYIPPEEYLPTEQDLKNWNSMEVKDRPHGLLIPKKFPNLRSVGAYQHSVREAFERCLDLYLCPRLMKRRLNIDPESLVPKLPRAADLRPFPTAKCIQYDTPTPPISDENNDAPPVMIRCLSPSPNGQFLVSGATDGFVRLWEVATGRLLQSWNVSKIVQEKFQSPHDIENNNKDDKTSTTKSTAPTTALPVISLEWNPNRNHHVVLAAVGPCVILIATGTTSNADEAETTSALLHLAASRRHENKQVQTKAAKAIKWVSLVNASDDNDDSKQEQPLSTFSRNNNGDGSTSSCNVGPVCALVSTNNKQATHVKWHRKGDYFLSVSPKAQAAAVLIHQLSKAQSQQPFGKAKGEAQTACFHPNKPFLFVANQQHVRVYHLVKQTMVKRLISGCRWISSMDVHPTGDHLIIGTLDRRMIWFDLDLSSTPYKTLKYHERALRQVHFHTRYPLMASASDDGAVHIFHSMVYSDLMRNPLIVPVKVLRGHSTTTKSSGSKLGVLGAVFHPTQPWIFTAGADGKILLFQDI